MLDFFLATTQQLIKKNEPFAIATVVRKDEPSSGKVGDRAIINKYGEITGWVGGGCVKGILLKEAESAMRTGKSKLVKIGKSIEISKQNGVMEYRMTCQSEGTVEIFIEAVLPKPHIVVIGKSEIAKAVVKLAYATGYRVTAVAQDATLHTFDKVDELITRIHLKDVKTTPASFIIVATQGEGDETALTEAFQKEKAMLGFVASRKKMSAMALSLELAGSYAPDIASIVSPIGLDIHAKLPTEVAISILAELIQHQNTQSNTATFQKFEANPTSVHKNPVYYTNPVCGVPVDINNPKHIIAYKGENVYFCCDGCKVKFEATPEKYMVKS